MHIKKHILRLQVVIIVLFIIYISFCIPIKVYPQEKEKRVLFISSYSESFESVPEQIEGIVSVFKPNNIKLDIEYMDMKRFDTDENKENFYHMLDYKLRNTAQYDAILVGDDAALQFAMERQNELFNEMPIVFLGINDLNRAAQAAKDDQITGVVEAFSFEDTIKIAKKFNEKATKVVAIVDNTLTGKGDKEQFYKIQDQFNTLVFEDINASDYSFKELGDVFENIQKDTIVLYLSLFQDKTGESLTIDQAVKLLTEHINVPIYRTSIGGVGAGLLGGEMISYFEQGKVAADMVLQVFDGKSIKSIGMIEKSPNKYVFDYNIIKKYSINEKLIPADAILLNKKITFYEQYKKIIWIVLWIIAFLSSISIVAIIDNIRRRKIEKALSASNEEIAQMYEELMASEEELQSQYHTIQMNMEDMKILNQKYEIAIAATDSAVWEINLNDGQTFISKEINTIFNQSINPTGHIYDILKQVLKTKDTLQLIKLYKLYKKGQNDQISCYVEIETPQGSMKWILIRGKGIFDSKKQLIKLSGIALDMTGFKKQQEYIKYLAEHDFLTQLPNRKSFMDKIKEEISEGKQGAIALLDIDNFKGINDILGHAFGDKVLVEFSNRLSLFVGEQIFVSRFGGDEFLILICNECKREAIEDSIQPLLKELDRPFYINGNKKHIHCSVGITQFPVDSDDVEQLMMYADMAMYNVKHSGKDHYMFFEKSMMEQLSENSEIEQILFEALKTDGLTLLYQPQIDVVTGKIAAFEALLRLKNYTISPAKFIPIAEESGVILEIGRWIVKEVIHQISIWKSKGFEIKPISFNFSCKQLTDVGFCEYLQKILLEEDVEAKYIEMEITESILAFNTDDTIKFLDKIKKMGLKISLDDFGTGYSSLSYLTFLPIDKIKLDKSILDEFLKPDKISIMDNIISLAHSLGLEITAEGIENIQQYKYLRKAACDYIQGYLFSKPIEINKVDSLYEDNFLENI